MILALDLAVPVVVSYKGVSNKKMCVVRNAVKLYFLSFMTYAQFVHTFFYEELLHTKLVLGQPNG